MRGKADWSYHTGGRGGGIARRRTPGLLLLLEEELLLVEGVVFGHERPRVNLDRQGMSE